jgi:hypothetical protein
MGRIELETTQTKNRALLGTLVGAGVGFGFSIALLAAADNPDAGEAAPYALAFFGGIGMGLGLVFGLLAKRESIEPHLVYESPRSGPEIGFFPILSKDTKGAGVSITF